MGDPWGKICIGVRLEKMVDAGFFKNWSYLIFKGMRRGDGFLIADGMVAHMAANKLVRDFLRTDADTLFMLDSDADIDVDFLNEFRDYEPGWEYDVLQAWYPRRGWPPEAIWFQKTVLGDTYQASAYQDEFITDVAICGTHALLIRRAVLEAQLGGVDPKEFDWFFYPRHVKSSEDAAWSREVAAMGFRLGATTHVKSGHISRVTIGWETYQEYRELSGANEFLERYGRVVNLVAMFTGEPFELVQAKLLRSSANVRDAWEAAKCSRANTPEDVRAFYGADDNGYLYDLLAWNFSPAYNQITAPLKAVSGKRVLVVGGGIGGEADRLADRNQVDVFELPGVLKRFCEYRLDSRVRMLAGDTVVRALEGESEIDDEGRLVISMTPSYNLIVMIDVVEHIHPAEFDATMDMLWAHLRQSGSFYIHAAFGRQEQYPMHYDNQAAFDAWAARRGLIRKGEYEWTQSS
jgi:hypothetical protein